MTKDFRHRINETWKAMRKLSQNWNCCVITATQADAQAYKKGETGRLNFSEDKRKYAHVTASYGFSQNPKEKEQGILRIGALVVREDDFNEWKKVRVLQSIRCGKPCLGSFF